HPRHWPSVMQEGRAPLHAIVGVVETLMQRLDWHENFTLHGTQHARCSSLASKASRCRSRLRVDSSSCRTTRLIRGSFPLVATSCDMRRRLYSIRLFAASTVNWAIVGTSCLFQQARKRSSYVSVPRECCQ